MKTKLPHSGWIRVEGPDAEKFLQGQITCDCREIALGDSTLAAHCNPKGRIISLFRLFRTEDGFLMNLPGDMVEIALANFSKYIVFFKAEISDVSDSVFVYGDEERNIHFSDEAIELEDHAKQWHINDIKQGLPMIYAASSEKYLPHYLNLQELNAISFKKGCYTGQEIIARMQHRGTLKYHMVYKTYDAKPEDCVDACEDENGTWHVLEMVKKD